MTKPEHETALENNLMVKDCLKKLLHGNQFRRTEYKQNRVSENSSPITDSPAPISTSAKKILRENKSLNTPAQISKEKTPTFIHHLKNYCSLAF